VSNGCIRRAVCRSGAATLDLTPAPPRVRQAPRRTSEAFSPSSRAPPILSPIPSSGGEGPDSSIPGAVSRPPLRGTNGRDTCLSGRYACRSAERQRAVRYSTTVSESTSHSADTPLPWINYSEPGPLRLISNTQAAVVLSRCPLRRLTRYGTTALRSTRRRTCTAHDSDVILSPRGSRRGSLLDSYECRHDSPTRHLLRTRRDPRDMPTSSARRDTRDLRCGFATP